MSLFVLLQLRRWPSGVSSLRSNLNVLQGGRKRFVLTAILLVYAQIAVAQPLRQTTSFRCRDAAALVVSSGAVVIGTGAHTYERFVAGAGCGKASDEPAWVAASDTSRCFIGYRCVNRSN
jgi:hypothetical protein